MRSRRFSLFICYARKPTTLRKRGIACLHLKLSCKKFSKRTIIAVHCHNQRDNCETLNMSGSLPPPRGFDIVGYLYKVVRRTDEERR